MVGQAKHYNMTQIGTEHIRELVGSVSLARAGVYGSGTNPLSDLNVRVADPIFLMFFTTGTISANAWQLLNRSGVIGMDGEMIAAFLADRQFGAKDGAFNADEFFIRLNELAPHNH